MVLLTTLALTAILPRQEVAPAAALAKLVEGNKRYVAGESLHREDFQPVRSKVAAKQHPFAVIVGCSDSRVGPEIIFDQGLGDLFVVRTAGNLVDTLGLASAEYAVDHLGARLIVVLGHERCGAIQAAIETYGGAHHDAHHAGHLDQLLAAIKPSVQATKGKPDRESATINENITRMVHKLRTTPGPLKTRLAKGEIRIVGARYDLDSGTVTLMQN